MNLRSGAKWLGPPAVALTALCSVIAIDLSRSGGASNVDLLSNSTPVGSARADAAVDHAAEAVGLAAWRPSSDATAGLTLSAVDYGRVLNSGDSYLTYSFAEAAEGSLFDSVTVTEFSAYQDFPIENSLVVPVTVSDVRVWTPPTPFVRNGRVNSQFVVRTPSRQFLVWFVGNAPPTDQQLDRTIRSLPR
jgi:hypothetical protein